MYPESLKCITSNASNKEIIKAHDDVYINCKFEVLEKIIVYDETLFLYFLDQIPQYKTAFVTVSFNSNNTLDYSRLPKKFFSMDQIQVIKQVIDYINKLCALVTPPPDINDDDVSLIEYVNPCDIFSTKVLTDLYLVKTCGDSCIEEDYFNKYIIFNKGYTYNSMVTLLFPELKIGMYRFPYFKENSLPEEMLLYELNYNKNSFDVIIQRILDYFDTTNTQSVKISEIEEDEVVEINQYYANFQIVKQFIDDHVLFTKNSKTKSSVLFKHFQVVSGNGSGGNGSSVTISQKQFSLLVKKISTFDSKRESTGQFWIDLQIKSA